MNVISRMMVPAVAAGLLLAGISASKAQFFNYSVAFTNTSGTTTYPSTTGTVHTTSADSYFTVAPGGNSTGLLANNQIGLFTLTPISTNTLTVSGFAVTDTTFSALVSIQRVSDINGTTNIGSAGTFTVTGNINGNLSANNDTVKITNIGGLPTSVTSGGEVFNITFDSVRNPGVPSSGNTGGVTIDTASTVASTPEPGTIAMLVGMGISGSAFVLRLRRASK